MEDLHVDRTRDARTYRKVIPCQEQTADAASSVRFSGFSSSWAKHNERSTY